MAMHTGHVAFQHAVGILVIILIRIAIIIAIVIAIIRGTSSWREKGRSTANHATCGYERVPPSVTSQ
eukprot:scaffold223433_cov41-Attheya_sp.AAC.3